MPPKKSKTQKPILVVESIDYGDVGVDFDGQTVEDGGFVAPLADGVEGRLIKEGVAFEDLEGADGAVDGDDRVEFYCAFVADLKRERGVGGLDAMREHGGIDVRDVDGVGSGRARDGGLGASGVERDAAGALRLRTVFANAGRFLDSLC